MNAVEGVKLLLISSGAGWVIWALGALSVATLAVALERWIFFRNQSCQPAEMARRLDERLSRGALVETAAEFSRSRAIAARVAAAGLRLARLGPESAKRAMESAVALERRLLERRLAFIGTVGNNAPFIGLFGTVIGVIHAFEELGHGAPVHGSAAGAVGASQAVMTGLAEALVATAIGIAVALPAIAFYNALQRRVAMLLQETDAISSLLLAYLSADRGGGTGGPRGSPGGPAPDRAGAGALVEEAS
jgi:biopolymer transport protein ExbB